MRRGIGQAIGRKHAIQAGATYPVIGFPVFIAHVHVLDACGRRHDKLLGGPGPIASLVEPGIVLRVQGKLTFDLAGAEVASPVRTALLLNPGNAGVPHETVDNMDVIR